MEVQVGCNGKNEMSIRELASANNLRPCVICTDEKDAEIIALGFEGEEADCERFLDDYRYYCGVGWNKYEQE